MFIDNGKILFFLGEKSELKKIKCNLIFGACSVCEIQC